MNLTSKQSGYVIKIRAFLPCGKDAVSHNAAFQRIDAMRAAIADLDIWIIEESNEFKPCGISGRKVAQESGHGAAAPAVAAPDAPPKAVTGGAIDDMPPIPDYLRRPLAGGDR